jgi:hypothetical protein
MNVETGTEAAQFPEKEYINRILLAVYKTDCACPSCPRLSLTLLVPTPFLPHPPPAPSKWRVFLQWGYCWVPGEPTYFYMYCRISHEKIITSFVKEVPR